LSADGGLIERPDRLVIVLIGAGVTGLGVPWAIHVAMWLLAAGSVLTVFQRVLAVRGSAGARDVLPLPTTGTTPEDGQATAQ
jgi:CDP-diacylglycerol--glycerol-3-phosphate 3-phosphatidyltransferase